MEPIVKTDSEDSTFNFISYFCAHLSSPEEEAPAQNFLRFHLYRLAYATLLREPNPLNEGDGTRGNGSTVNILSVLNIIERRRGNWTGVTYEEAKTMIDGVEGHLHDYHWIEKLKYLSVNTSGRPSDDRTTSEKDACPQSFRVSEDSGYEESEKRERRFRNLIERLIEETAKPALIRENNGTTSGSFLDEGAFSLSSASAAGDGQSDSAHTLPYSCFWETDSYGWTLSKRNSSDQNSRRIRDYLAREPPLVEVTSAELMDGLKALLVGVPTDKFYQVGQEFHMFPGLHTANLTSDFLREHCKIFQKAGHLFLRLSSHLKIGRTSIDVTVRSFIIDYLAAANIIDAGCSLLKAAKEVAAPFTLSMTYLVGLLDGDTSDQNLFETLHQHVLNTFEPKSVRLVKTLFMDCATTLFRNRGGWRFEGEWHPELYFKRSIPFAQMNRASWVNGFAFSTPNGPTFIPLKAIYECGKKYFPDKMESQSGASGEGDCQSFSHLENVPPGLVDGVSSSLRPSDDPELVELIVMVATADHKKKMEGRKNEDEEEPRKSAPMLAG